METKGPSGYPEVLPDEDALNTLFRVSSKGGGYSEYYSDMSLGH